MNLVLSVDVGGTFTDAFATDGERYATGKVKTTSHDLSIGFIGALEEAVAALGMGLPEGLARAEYIKYSTTVGMNALVERVGPRIGLITTRGQEDTLHLGRSRSWADGMPHAVQIDRTRARRPPDLIPRQLRVGVRERIDCFGRVIMPLQADDVMEQVDRLVENGVQAFAVCLTWSFMNPVHEIMVRDHIREHYPEIYLGRAPVLISSEVAPKLDEYRRTMTTALAAYLSVLTEDHLLDLADRLRALGYRRPLLLARNIGGVASPSRTTALHLLGAGAVAGLSGVSMLAARYGLRNVIAADMGGTTFDVGLLVDGQERSYELDPIVDRWRIHLPVLATFAIGAGGGSIAWLTEEGELRVGPRSAGSVPGPACYDYGGTEPTVTDADLVLGYLDPDYFLGGRFKLNSDRAGRTIRRRIAEPLGIDVEEAALRIRRLVDGMMGQEIHKRTALKGHDPREFVMFAFGGAGPVHAAEIATFADLGDVLTFPFGSEFNAFGAASMDVVQSYERSHRVRLYDPVRAAWFQDFGAFNRIVDDLLAAARRDLSEEGFELGELTFELELDMNYSGQHHTVRHPAGRMRLDTIEDVQRLAADFNATFATVYGVGATHPEGGIEVQLFKLNATAKLPKPAWGGRGTEPPSDPPKPKGRRACRWTTDRVETDVYERSQLGGCTRIVGPALIEDVDTVVAVPPGWSYELDPQLTGRLRRTPA